MPQAMLMIQGNGGDDAHLAAAQVGRIQPAPQTHFNHIPIDVLIGKMLKGEGGAELKIRNRDVQLLHRLLNAGG